MNDPVIRILLATRNGAAHLQEQLDSYLTQDHDRWALWVSDDGSDDGTWALLERFRDAHPDLPPGPVTLSDQDDVWMPHRLSRAWAVLGTDPAPALYGATTIETTPDLTPLPRQKGPLTALRTGEAPDIPFHNWWLYLRLAGVGARITLDAQPVLHYRQHASNVIGAHTGARAGFSRATALIGVECRRGQNPTPFSAICIRP